MKSDNLNIHATADVQSKYIGRNTRVCQYSVVSSNAKIGSDVTISSHCFIDNNVIIGDRVTIKSGVQLWNGIRIEDDVYIGPNVTFSNDGILCLDECHEQILETHIERGSKVGGGATILRGITISTKSMVEAGAVVTQNVPPYAIVTGSPARIIGYVQTSSLAGISSVAPLNPPSKEGMFRLGVGNATLHFFKQINDIRGELCVGLFNKEIPFEPKRFFFVFNVPSEKNRGEHAHYNCEQFLICIKGKCSVVVDDGNHRAEVCLDLPNKGIYLPPLTWGIQYQFTRDAVLLVFASHDYESNDYIRDYQEFLKTVLNK